MNDDQQPPMPSRLILALRGAIAVVQMILYKEVRDLFKANMPELEVTDAAMLAGAVTNEVFGAENSDPKYLGFREKHRATIEQALIRLADDLPALMPHLTDTLRIQTLCDHQEGEDSTRVLIRASELGILDESREIPLPSNFMTLARALGEQYNLVVPPSPDVPEDGGTTIH